MRLVFIALLVAGCAQSGANQDPDCHPLAVGDCTLPWPSSYYIKSGKIALPPNALPEDQIGVPMSPARINQLDGFSPSTPILANLKVALDPAQFPRENEIEKSLLPSSTVQLYELDTWTRVPLFAEVDNNANPAEEDRLLIIQPMVRLMPKSRYVVILQNLVDDKGRRVTVPTFEALKSGSDDPRLRELKQLFDSIWPRLEGVTKSDVTFGWDFVTGSDATANLIAMRDIALAEWEKQSLGYTVVAEDRTDDHLLRELKGTFQVPSFLESDDVKAILQFGSDGKPKLRGPQDFPLVVHIPKCALTAPRPLPIMVFGHGLFGSAIGEMNSGYEKSVIDDLCMVQVGTNWIGLSTDDVASVAAYVIADFSKIPIVTDRLQQAQVNFLVLARLALRKLKNDPGLMVNGRAVTDGSEIYYYGISQGGIEGGPFMALTPDIVRGVLNVGAAQYSLMLPRSVDFNTLKRLLDITYPSQRDQNLLLAVSQSYWDFAEPSTFAGHLVADTLPGLDGNPLPPRKIILQEALGDSQVPNLATRKQARSIGLAQLGPPVEAVYGLDQVTAPQDSAYTQWDVHPNPVPPMVNTPLKDDNSVHGQIRKLPALIEQLRRFFRPDGRVEHTCGGACVFEPPR